MYSYDVFINQRPIYHFRLPFKLNEERIKEVCQLQIKTMPGKWAKLILNDECIYSFPISNEEDIDKFEMEVKFNTNNTTF
jgi:hypothetical protein